VVPERQRLQQCPRHACKVGLSTKRRRLLGLVRQRQGRGWRRRVLHQQTIACRRRASSWSGKRKRQCNVVESDVAQPHPKFRKVMVSDNITKVSGGQASEASREKAGLVLLGQLAPMGAAWTYPLANEHLRCFAGYYPRAIGIVESARLFDIVKCGVDWLQPKGKWGPLPLRTAWMTKAPCSCTYGYGGAEVLPKPFPSWMTKVMAACMPLCGLSAPDEWPDSCNLNLYMDGGHSVGWHADNESLFQGRARDCCIISLSLGQTRTFELRTRGGGVHKLHLANGDLCSMEGLTQKHYQHCVPKEGASCERINLTWRWVVDHAVDCAVWVASSF